MRIGALTACEAFRPALIAQFIKHYLRWCEPEDIHVMIQRNDDSVDNSQAKRVCDASGVHWVDWCGPYSTEDIKRDHAERNKEYFAWDGWHFNVDSDEFFDWEVDVFGLCRRADETNKVFVRTQMIDMMAADGSFPEIPWDQNMGLRNMKYPDIQHAFPVECDITQGIVQGYPIKDCLLRNPYYGHHNAWGVDLNSQRMPGLYKLHHYKWDKLAYERMLERSKPENQARFPYWANFKLFTDYMDKHGALDPSKFPIDPSKFKQ